MSDWHRLIDNYLIYYKAQAYYKGLPWVLKNPCNNIFFLIIIFILFPYVIFLTLAFLILVLHNCIDSFFLIKNTNVYIDLQKIAIKPPITILKRKIKWKKKQKF